jgi:hypothetical protein
MSEGSQAGRQAGKRPDASDVGMEAGTAGGQECTLIFMLIKLIRLVRMPHSTCIVLLHIHAPSQLVNHNYAHLVHVHAVCQHKRRLALLHSLQNTAAAGNKKCQPFCSSESLS